MIDGAILAGRLLLALVFLVAGAAKLLDRAGSRRALSDFGAPEALAAPLSVALPLGELIVGAGLLAEPTALFAAVGAGALLSLFTVAIAVNLLQGRKPDCHCFGQLHSAPAGASTLARNAALAGVAGFLVFATKDHAGPGFTGAIAGLAESRAAQLGLLLCLLIVAAAQSALLFLMLRQQGRLLLRLETLEAGARPVETHVEPQAQEQPAAGLGPGARAPSFDLNTLENSAVSLDELLRANGALLLIFTNPKCGPCRALAPEIAHWRLDESLPAKIVLVSEGTTDDNLMKFGVGSDPLVLLQEKREVAEAYKANGTPAAVLIGRDGTIASGVAFGADAIRALVQDSPRLLRARDAYGGTAATSLLSASDRRTAPDVFLKDRGGASVPLASFAGYPTLLLFWNPGCGFCQRMESDLLAFDANPGLGAPKLVLILAEPEPADRPLHLRGKVMFDPDSSVAAALRAHGTPTAVLLDTEGRIASDVAAGAQAVFALAHAQIPVA